MKKVTKWIVRFLKCLLCILTGEYRDKDRHNGNDNGNVKLT